MASRDDHRPRHSQDRHTPRPEEPGSSRTPRSVPLVSARKGSQSTGASRPLPDRGSSRVGQATGPAPRTPSGGRGNTGSMGRNPKRTPLGTRAPLAKSPAKTNRYLKDQGHGAHGRHGLQTPKRRRRPLWPWIGGAVAVVVMASVLLVRCLGTPQEAGPAPWDTGFSLGASGVAGSVDALATADRQLAQAVAGLTDQDAQVGYCLMDTDGDVILSRNADMAFYAASSIKGPYVLATLSDESNGAPGALKDSVEQAIEYSDNNSYFALKDAFGVGSINSWLASVDAPEIQPGYSFVDLTPRQLAELWVKAYGFLTDGSEESQWLGNVFSEPLNSAISTVPALERSWSKPGWINTQDLHCTVNAGIVERKGDTYILAVMTDKGEDFEALDKVIVALDAVERAMAGDGQVAAEASTSSPQEATSSAQGSMAESPAASVEVEEADSD